MYNVQHVISLRAACAAPATVTMTTAAGARDAAQHDARDARQADAATTAGDTANDPIFFLLPLASVRVLRTQPHYAERKA